MIISRNSVGIAVFSALLYLAFSQEIHAYIDPGTGSFILQFVIAFLLGGLFIIRVKVKNLFKRLFSRGGKVEQSEE